MKNRIRLTTLAMLLASANLYANQPATDNVDTEIYETIDIMVEDTPHTAVTFDEMGGGVTETSIIADTLSDLEALVEGEDLLELVGSDKYAWKEGVRTTGVIVEPERAVAERASNGALVNVSLGRNFSETYALEFGFQDILPMRYRLEWRGNFKPSGLYAIFVNDEKIGEFDSFYFSRSIISVTGDRFLSDNGFNIKDFWVDNLNDYGEVRIRFEFLDSGEQSSNGLNIDYIKLIPEN